jgi:hypothetical protein
MYSFHDQIMEDEMDEACSTYRRDDNCVQNLLENLKGRDRLE